MLRAIPKHTRWCSSGSAYAIGASLTGIPMSRSEALANLPTLAGGPGEWATAQTRGSATEPSSSADRNEVVHADALHDEKPARAVGLAVHVMRSLRRHRASLARQETIDVARCACLDCPSRQTKLSLISVW